MRGVSGRSRFEVRVFFRSTALTIVFCVDTRSPVSFGPLSATTLPDGAVHARSPALKLAGSWWVQASKPHGNPRKRAGVVWLVK